jgi:CRP-like cAMP-binding protein
VKLSVLSKTGREAVVAMLGPGDFFGEGCLAGQPVCMGSATAITGSTILFVDKDEMVRLLHQQHALSDRFIAHILARNTRIEEDLVDQLFDSSEKAGANAVAARAVNNSLLTVVLHESQCHPSLKFGMQQDILETFVDRGQLRTLAQPTVYRAA